MNTNRNRKEDIICIWKELPYLGDVRDTSLLDFFSNYKMYEEEIRLMAQMRIILMSNYSYKDIKPYIESINHNDDKIYHFVQDATEFYITEIKPKHTDEKPRLEHYTESIRACVKTNIASDENSILIY